MMQVAVKCLHIIASKTLPIRLYTALETSTQMINWREWGAVIPRVEGNPDLSNKTILRGQIGWDDAPASELGFPRLQLFAPLLLLNPKRNGPSSLEHPPW